MKNSRDMCVKSLKSLFCSQYLLRQPMRRLLSMPGGWAE